VFLIIHYEPLVHQLAEVVLNRNLESLFQASVCLRTNSCLLVFCYCSHWIASFKNVIPFSFYCASLLFFLNLMLEALEGRSIELLFVHAMNWLISGVVTVRNFVYWRLTIFSVFLNFRWGTDFKIFRALSGRSGFYVPVYNAVSHPYVFVSCACGTKTEFMVC